MANTGLGKRKQYSIKFPIHMAEQLEEMAGFYGVSVQALVQMVVGQNLRASEKMFNGIQMNFGDLIKQAQELDKQG